MVFLDSVFFLFVYLFGCCCCMIFNLFILDALRVGHILWYRLLSVCTAMELLAASVHFFFSFSLLVFIQSDIFEYHHHFIHSTTTRCSMQYIRNILLPLLYRYYSVYFLTTIGKDVFLAFLHCSLLFAIHTGIFIIMQ